MCIIVAKPAGVPLPSRETLAECFKSNPHGAGFMFADGEKVNIRKGYMTKKSFFDAIDALRVDTTECAMVLHFRIATHGDIKAGTCHPFPVSTNVFELRRRKTTDTLAVAHNGVIHGMRTDAATSDTMVYIRDVLAPLRAMCGDDMPTDGRARSIIDATVGSKLAFLDSLGNITTFGSFIEDGGVLYSNESYRPPVLVPVKQAYEWPETWADAYALDDETLALLPFDVCEDCPECCDCALEWPLCSKEAEAEAYVAQLDDEWLIA